MASKQYGGRAAPAQRVSVLPGAYRAIGADFHAFVEPDGATVEVL
jgi:hypothetical protein